MEIYELEPRHRSALEQFLRRIPTSDRTFLKEAVDDPAVVAAWIETPGSRWVAVQDDAILGYAAVVALHGRSDHVGEIRLIVDPQRRGEGLGRALARHASLAALELGLTKLVVEVLATQPYTIEMFRSLGFDPEALLTGQVRGEDGELLDLMILAHSATEASAALAATGLSDADIL